ncbi:MAG TPA: hypothetical protein VJ692_03045 [Nitrospiraceae bacterium]|nr:hypothetical protein [Nitrospiraceae bacterium]
MWHWGKGKSQKVNVKSKGLKAFTFFLFTFALAVVGCSGRATRSDTQPLLDVTAGQLIQLLHERETAVQTMKGLFRAQIQGPGIPIAQRVEGALFYRRPDALRLQGFNRLGGGLFEFILGTDVYALRLPTGQVYSGRPAELERVGAVARPFRLSVLAMSGVVGTPSVTEQERVRVSMDGDRYRLDVFASSEQEPPIPLRRIWFDRHSLQVVQEDRMNPAGEVEASVQFEDYRSVNAWPEGGSVPTGHNPLVSLMKPFRVTAQDGLGRSIIFVTFHEIVPNARLKPDELKLAQATTTRKE